MLAIQNITSASGEVSVYTVPSGKSAYVYVDVFCNSAGNITIKINDTTFLIKSLLANDFISIKLMLTGGDVIKASTTGDVNIFVHGMVM